jgi:hypothetical protein
LPITSRLLNTSVAIAQNFVALPHTRIISDSIVSEGDADMPLSLSSILCIYLLAAGDLINKI